MPRNLGAIVITTIVALLVWIFAESESLRSREFATDVTFVVDAQSDRLVAVGANTGWTGRVGITLTGPAGSLERVERRLREGVRLAPGMAGVPLEVGTRAVMLRDAIRGLPIVRETGVTVSRVDPAEVLAEVDQVRQAEARVVVDAGDAELDGAPDVTPPTAQLRGPGRALDRLGAREPTVSLRLEPAALRNLVPGRRETLTRVPLRPPPELDGVVGVRVEPSTADVQLTLRSRTAQVELPAVPVGVWLAGSEMARFEVVIKPEDQFIRNVRVSGPSDLIAQVRSGELRISATVVLGFEELERGITSKDAVFNLVPSPLRVEADSRLVRFEIRRKPNGQPTPPGAER
ncbi:MAG: hypothetical protein FJ255_05825 [Phycisphaerae bacterium]|nr:hypothetical protein [Phycisphaerae bacterium]